jgi:hypothetical protein
MSRLPFVSLVLGLLLAACSSPPASTPDGGTTPTPGDAGRPPTEDAGGPPPMDAGSPPDAGPPPPDAGTPPPGVVRFVDVATDVGLDFVSIELDRLCINPFDDCDSLASTGALAIADVDEDGWSDVFLAGLDGATYYRNQGDGTFVDATAAVGLSFTTPVNGAAFADFDRDGDLDLYCTTFDNQGRRRLNYYFVQGPDGTFTEQARAAGNAVETPFDHAGGTVSIGDYDLDGYVDLHTSEWFSTGATQPTHARLLRNLGAADPGRFEDTTLASDALSTPRECYGGGENCQVVSFASSFTDLDGDGWPDLLLVQDFGLSRLYWNDGDGTFTDGTDAAGVGTDENGMGATAGDFDGDGLLDWFVTSIGDTGAICGGRLCQSGYNGNRLYLNRGDRTFADGTDTAGVRRGGWGWGAAAFDYDNDGDLDIVMVNGFTIPEDDWEDDFNDDALRLWDNVGGGFFFENSATRSLSHTAHATALGVFDYDNDGDLDILAVENHGPVRLWENQGGNASPWLRVDLVGTASTREGLHARVRVQAEEDGPVQLREVGSVTHFQAQSELTAHFGLGSFEGEALHRVTVDWPSGRRSVLTDVAPRQVLIIEEPDA